ncbi:hypothetical protein PV327_004514 [Microctonus hyperodae]|uniref:Uncharacterized protein n=1 Tax=Microctonus hyperodae TaxID=165561 RepID=A0AA39FCL8_MICHY|nr:hypothetical protein PV327_004514 [Microctonus hyperodae]
MMQLILIFGVTIVVNVAISTSSPASSKCGQCLAMEYCSAFDSLCNPCLTICDERNHNHDLSMCVKDCQEYMHDEKYALHAKLSEVESLKGKMEKLSSLLEVSFAFIIFLTLLIIFLLLKTLLKLKIINEALGKIFGQKWMKSTKKSNDKVRSTMWRIMVAQ